jgi:hypothetical protein
VRSHHCEISGFTVDTKVGVESSLKRSNRSQAQRVALADNSGKDNLTPKPVLQPDQFRHGSHHTPYGAFHVVDLRSVQTTILNHWLIRIARPADRGWRQRIEVTIEQKVRSGPASAQSSNNISPAGLNLLQVYFESITLKDFCGLGADLILAS